jgi:hypothetical protein
MLDNLTVLERRLLKYLSASQQVRFDETGINAVRDGLGLRTTKELVALRDGLVAAELIERLDIDETETGGAPVYALTARGREYIDRIKKSSIVATKPVSSWFRKIFMFLLDLDNTIHL